MGKIFTKEEAQKLNFADAVHVWTNLDEINDQSYYSHWNVTIWEIYGTRLDVNGLHRKNIGLTWNTYGTKWLLSTPNNSYNKRSNIGVEDIKRYLKK